MAYAHNPVLKVKAAILRIGLEQFSGFNGHPIEEGLESSAFKTFSDWAIQVIEQYGHSSPEGIAALNAVLTVTPAWLDFADARDSANANVAEENVAEQNSDSDSDNTD